MGRGGNEKWEREREREREICKEGIEMGTPFTTTSSTTHYYWSSSGVYLRGPDGWTMALSDTTLYSRFSFLPPSGTCRRRRFIYDAGYKRGGNRNARGRTVQTHWTLGSATDHTDEGDGEERRMESCKRDTREGSDKRGGKIRFYWWEWSQLLSSHCTFGPHRFMRRVWVRWKIKLSTCAECMCISEWREVWSMKYAASSRGCICLLRCGWSCCLDCVLHCCFKRMH